MPHNGKLIPDRKYTVGFSIEIVSLGKIVVIEFLKQFGLAISLVFPIKMREKNTIPLIFFFF